MGRTAVDCDGSSELIASCAMCSPPTPTPSLLMSMRRATVEPFASSSDASCPDVALMRLQEEAQTWIDARISRKAKSRGGRGGWTAVGAGEEDEEGGRAAQAGAGRGGGEAENEKKERWWGLVSGFAHKVPKA